MKVFFPSLKKNLFILLSIALYAALSIGIVSAGAFDHDHVTGVFTDEVEDPHDHSDGRDHGHDHDFDTDLDHTHDGQSESYNDCIIPESGPWPPCATGGNDQPETNDDCVIPPSGPWPPCATGGGGGSAPSPTPAPGEPCPESGKWPPGCVPGGGDSSPTPAPAPGNDDACVIPDSGPWPPCATGGSGAAPAPAPAPSISFDDLAARVYDTQQYLENYWIGEFKQWGISYQPPSLVQVYVGDEGDPPNAFYVPSMNAIFIDLRLLSEIADEWGEFAAVAVLAHEWAHFIQDELNLLSGNRPLRQIELQADCFSGSFTRYLEAIGQLSPGEFEAGQNVFFSVGDDQINPDAPYDQPGAHGTGEERRTAYTYGYDNSANGCRGAYNN